MAWKQSCSNQNSEFFVDIDGKKRDSVLHESILAGSDEVAVRNIGKEAARRVGLTEAQIAKPYSDK